jgi:hypothetical protein
MAGVLKKRTIINCTGLGDEFNIDTGDVTQTVPVEHGGQGRYIIHSTATTYALQLSDLFPQLALTKIYGVYIKAEVGTIYILLNTAGVVKFDSDTADLTLLVGESCYLPINTEYDSPNGPVGLKINGSSATDAFTITAFAKA